MSKLQNCRGSLPLRSRGAGFVLCFSTCVERQGIVQCFSMCVEQQGIVLIIFPQTACVELLLPYNNLRTIIWGKRASVLLHQLSTNQKGTCMIM